jgi:hypothetical protein
VAAVTLLAGCGTAAVQRADPSQSGTPAGPVTAADAVQPCDLPGKMGGPAPGQGLTGPAVTDLAGGAVTGGFSHAATGLYLTGTGQPLPP